MGFHDVEFPRAISKGSRVGLAHNTAVVDRPSGKDERVVRWSRPKIRYDVGYGAKTTALLREIIDFHRCRGGRANSFRFWDPVDYSTNPAQRPFNDATVNASETDEALPRTTDGGAGGDGSCKTFQLVKRYASGAQSKVRNLTRPIVGTVKVALAGVLQSSGYSVDYATGIVTFASAPGNGVAVTGGCKFNVPVFFESDELVIDLEEYDDGTVVSGINVVEDLSDEVLFDDFPFRGGSYQSFSAPLKITPMLGYFIRLAPSTTGLSVELPDVSNYEEGGPHWKLRNETAHPVAVNYLGTTLFTLQATGDSQRRDVAEIVLGIDGSGVVGWQGVT